MSRPRGYADWNPQKAGRDMVKAVDHVLTEYRDYLPMTLRQIFYRLVTKGAVDKTEKGYKKLCEHMNRARRAQLIPMESIRDDGTTVRMGHDFDNEDDLRHYLENFASDARLDLQRGQPVRLEVWSEAAGMVPQLERVAHKYGVPVISSGGFDSLTAKHDMALRYAGGGNTTVLHIGDYDPSGVHIFSSLAEDIKAFVYGMDGDDIAFERLLVLPEHIEEYGLPTAPPKASDRRSFGDTRTVQAEAFDPATLAKILEDAIIALMDMVLYANAVKYQSEARANMTKKVA